MSISGELLYFLLLSPAEQAQAIREMAAGGWSDYGIAGATRLSVEQVRKIRGTSSGAGSAQEPLHGV
jgi:hypothetical protein